MIIKQTQTLIFQYPDDYIAEHEWNKTKDDKWVHKGTDTQCSVYELTTDFYIQSNYAQQTDYRIIGTVGYICPKCGKGNFLKTENTCVYCGEPLIKDKSMTEDEILREQCRAFIGIVEQTERREP